MSKKKRYRKPNVPRKVGQANGSYQVLSSAATSGINTDHAYIIKDLKRIAVIAAGLITGLIVLSIILS